MVATPGISSGYWNARNTPLAARSSGSIAEEVLAVEQDLAVGHLVAGLAGQHIGERRLARAVRAHDGVHLALVHGEVETLEDLLAVDGDVQVLDFEHRHFVVPSRTASKLKCEMISAISSFFPVFLVVGVDRAERASADVDLALLADHDHHSFRVHALFGLGQQDALAVERRLHAVLLQARRRRQIGLEEVLQKRRRRLLAGATLGARPCCAWRQAPQPPCRAPTCRLFPPDTELSRPSLRG